MEILKLFLNWTSSVAWPATIIILSIIFREPLLGLFDKIGAIAERAGKEPFDLQLGEKLKISFKEAIKAANPKTVDEAVEIAEKEAEKAINIFNLLGNIPLQQHHKDLLLKVAKGEEKGIHWVYGGSAEKSPGRTMGFLIQNGLVHREEDRYFAHSLVREYIFKVHSGKKS